MRGTQAISKGAKLSTKAILVFLLAILLIVAVSLFDVIPNKSSESAVDTSYDTVNLTTGEHNDMVSCIAEAMVRQLQPEPVYAAGEHPPQWPYPDNPYMNKGKIHMYTISKAATSGIYYQTIGFTVHKQKAPNGDVSKISHGTMMLKQDKEYALSSDPTMLVTEFVVDQKEVTSALNQVRDKNGNQETWKDGETIYLSHIIEVRKK